MDTQPRAKTSGTALYRDRYLKVDGRWLIKDTYYERIYEFNEQLETSPALSAHYLGVHGGGAVLSAGPWLHPATGDLDL
ncbi:MAG: hypothetical protein H6992_09125 [Pseudomonadales bacterium]|nr:hypothetical protein [Pseudomonadales bacterium]